MAKSICGHSTLKGAILAISTTPAAHLNVSEVARNELWGTEPFQKVGLSFPLPPLPPLPINETAPI